MNMDINIDDREIDIDEGFYVDLFDNQLYFLLPNYDFSNIPTE